jgi:type I restriction enzyme S subunit
MKKGWQTARLGDLIELISGQHIDSKDYNTSGRGVGYLTGPSDFGPIYPVVTKWTEHPKIKAKKNDILITVKGSGVGKVNLMDADEVAISRQLMAIRVVNAERQFVYLLLESVFDHFQEESTGAAIPGISREQVLGLQIPVPPLAEQQRIVGVLDEAFASLTAAQAHAAQNLQNARDLFESHLNAVFTQRVEGWMEKKLGEVSQFKNGLNYNKSSGGQTLPVVGVADFQDNYLVPLSELQSATIDGVIADNYAIQPNDILTVRSNGSKHLVGRCMLVGDVDEVVSYSGFIIRIRFDAKTIFPQFLLHFMKSQVTRDFLTAGGGGANINNINQEKLSALLVPIPPYKTQVNLAAALDELREETERLTQIYEQKLAALAALKKSLLHQAFSGEL